MKIIYTLIVLVVISSCTSEKQNVDSIGTAENVASFPLQTVKEKFIERKSYFALDSVDLTELVAIDSTFYKRYFLDLPVNNLNDYKLEFDPYSRYYFYDYKDVGDLALFSIIHDDEVGYANLYHFTFDKAKNQLLHVDFLAATGSDGGHRNFDKLNFSQSGDSLIHTSLSNYQEYIQDGDGSVTQYDSVIYKVLFSKNSTKFIKLDSLVRMDTVWRKN